MVLPESTAPRKLQLSCAVLCCAVLQLYSAVLSRKTAHCTCDCEAPRRATSSPVSAPGAEQAGDTRLPAVFFSRSLRSTIASLPSTYATDAVTSHKASAGQTQTLNGGQAHTLNAGQVQTLLEEGATEWDVGQSKLFVSALQQQGDSVACRGKTATPARHLAAPPKGGSGPLTGGDGSKSGTNAATEVQDDGKDQIGSTACVAETGLAQAVAMATISSSSYEGPHVVKLLAHTEGGVSVQQAVLNHFSQRPQSESMADSKPLTVLAVGPEGGWTPSEIALFTEEHAFQMVTTSGGRTLDTTTAIISLVSLVSEAMIRYNVQRTN